MSRARTQLMLAGQRAYHQHRAIDRQLTNIVSVAGGPETNGDRVVVYSSGQPVAGRAQPRTVLAVFDDRGKGTVYDHAGQIRLKYSQSEGVVVDRTLGPNTHWKWHNLCDSRLLKTVLKENEPLIKDQTIAEYQEEDEIDFERPIPDDDHVMRGLEAQEISKQIKECIKNYASFQIKMKAVKINEHFALKIFQQSSIFLSFTDGKTHIRINVGMVLDPNVVVGEDFQDLREVPGVMDQVARSESVERLQKVVQGARAVERANVLRERRLNITPSFLFQKKH
ncbi:uncharacterized protein LOC134805015 [Cydia splendana]|uniref:uncharacterized protein LOC134805015 n=1 Tax=Cydia splendana TaxID=1100963 RepID=UPI00300D0782